MSGEHSGDVSDAHLQAIYAQAAAEFPAECCGYIVGDGPTAQLVPCKNRQDQLHALDPEANPRTSANGYSIGGKELLQLMRAFETDTPPRIIYHSHPRVGAYFSEEDTRAALSAGFNVQYLVVDAQPSGAQGAVLFERQADVYIEVATFGEPAREQPA